MRTLLTTTTTIENVIISRQYWYHTDIAATSFSVSPVKPVALQLLYVTITVRLHPSVRHTRTEEGAVSCNTIYSMSSKHTEKQHWLLLIFQHACTCMYIHVHVHLGFTQLHKYDCKVDVIYFTPLWMIQDIGTADITKPLQ